LIICGNLKIAIKEYLYYLQSNAGSPHLFFIFVGIILLAVGKSCVTGKNKSRAGTQVVVEGPFSTRSAVIAAEDWELRLE